jgi:short-subunit dehydrogenase
MSLNLKPIDQQVVVITGASSGIGLATAAAAGAQRAKLVLAARSADSLADIVRTLGGYEVEAESVAADVGDRSQVDRIAEAAIERFGRIDTWINNAGVSIYGRLDEISEDDSRRLFDTNYWGVVNGSLAALPYLRRRGGALINLGSEVSESVLPLQGVYAASKHAVKGFTDALRVELELERLPISVTLIQPTAVDTPLPQHARNYMDREPKLPTPLIDPATVADAIIAAATQPVREVKVGLMAKVNTALFKMAPGIGEWVARMQAHRQHYDEPPRDPQGALHRAGGGGRIHGTGPSAGRSRREA